MRSIEPGIHSSTDAAARWIPGSILRTAPE